jgi:rRNA-processing protein FCF1
MKESLVVSYCRAAASRKKKNRALLTNDEDLRRVIMDRGRG